MDQREKLLAGQAKDFSISDTGLLRYHGQVCLPMDSEIQREILNKAHTTPYSLHPGTTKMYQDLRVLYWWPGMKKDVVGYVAKCLTCQQVKAEHQRPAGLLQRIGIPEWKWDDITMDFVVGLPRTVGQYDSIWVIVGRYTKSAHFLLVRTSYTVEQYAELYVKEIVRIHVAPKSIISDRDPTFMSMFWGSLQRQMGTQLQFSISFHP